MDLRAKTCCFTGHRSLSGEEKLKAAVRLRRVIEEQIKAGIVFYGAGGVRVRPEDGAVRILQFMRISSAEAIRLCMCPGNTPRTACTGVTAIWWITAEPVSAT